MSHALVFRIIILQDALASGTEVHVDGTFKTVPTMFMQLMTFHVIKFNHVSNINMYKYMVIFFKMYT